MRKWKIKKFKDLSLDKLYEILKLRNKIFIVDQKSIYQDCDDKDKKSYHLFCEEDGKIICYLRILEKGISYEEISIGRVLVNENFRGQKLARQSMVKAIEFIENVLLEKVIIISAQSYLVKFYESLAFRVNSEIYKLDGIQHIEMIYKK